MTNAVCMEHQVYSKSATAYLQPAVEEATWICFRIAKGGRTLKAEGGDGGMIAGAHKGAPKLI